MTNESDNVKPVIMYGVYVPNKSYPLVYWNQERATSCAKHYKVNVTLVQIRPASQISQPPTPMPASTLTNTVATTGHVYFETPDQLEIKKLCHSLNQRDEELKDLKKEHKINKDRADQLEDLYIASQKQLEVAKESLAVMDVNLATEFARIIDDCTKVGEDEIKEHMYPEPMEPSEGNETSSWKTLYLNEADKLKDFSKTVEQAQGIWKKKELELTHECEQLHEQSADVRSILEGDGREDMKGMFLGGKNGLAAARMDQLKFFKEKCEELKKENEELNHTYDALWDEAELIRIERDQLKEYLQQLRRNLGYRKGKYPFKSDLESPTPSKEQCEPSAEECLEWLFEKQFECYKTTSQEYVVFDDLGDGDTESKGFGKTPLESIRSAMKAQT